ncbi:hypothetical protein FA15DRAFT_659826 [Coprinopsis marcescibilis]|uniref:Uncharacterized protein n=1 Tax=Coprinopsis marcescibilis TaxID=230819 RepID=A0A5C3KI31_COPMA|nr:hypothetical protein FA15DRAFT_659826 [Coprinopsis marcescibilis]
MLEADARTYIQSQDAPEDVYAQNTSTRSVTAKNIGSELPEPPSLPSHRPRRVPKQYNDFVLSSTDDPEAPSEQVQPSTSNINQPSRPRNVMTTPDSVGTFRIYPIYSMAPSQPPPPPPQDSMNPNNAPAPTVSLQSLMSTLIAPFKNITHFRMMEWYYCVRGFLFLSHFKTLVKEILQSNDLWIEDVATFNISNCIKALDSTNPCISPFSQTGICGPSTDQNDSKLCHLFPRFFFYSTDYPEKVLLATVKYLGRCGCPKCFTPKSQFQNMGTTAYDKTCSELQNDNAERQKWVEEARKLIFKNGYSPNLAHVDKLLSERSEVPVHNTFSKKLYPMGFNFYSMLVPDILHEFELGVWKAVYQKVPTYGNGTIQRFATSASAMKKLAGRDFEDLLQAMTSSSHLVQPFVNSVIWQAESTKHMNYLENIWLEYIDRCMLQQKLRVCLYQPLVTMMKNLWTKFHSLGHAAEAISLYSTLDNCNTQVGEQKHPVVKKFYVHTNKNRSFPLQVAHHFQRSQLLSTICNWITDSQETEHLLKARECSKCTGKQEANVYDWVGHIYLVVEIV